MDYYSIIKKNKIMTFAATWMALEIVILVKSVRHRKTNIVRYCFHVESKKGVQKNLVLLIPEVESQMQKTNVCLPGDDGEGKAGRLGLTHID